MSSCEQTSLPQALDLHCPSYADCSIDLPRDICLGSVSSGGYVAALLSKVAILHAAQHQKISHQTDVRSMNVNFLRPVFPDRGSANVTIQDLGIGKGWSTLRAELRQNQLCVIADVIVTNFTIAGFNLESPWRPSPPVAVPSSFTALEDHLDADWACYHTAFHRNGFRRGHAYVKNYISRYMPDRVERVDQWLVPGWDCLPGGSRDPSVPEARWTNELLPFVADSHLPVQQNFLPTPPGAKLPSGSLAATLGYAAAQKRAREQGKKRWRDVEGDGALVFDVKTINVSLNINLEVKRRLPADGVRFLFVRAEVKSIIDGRMDIEVQMFDPDLRLILLGSQVAQMVESAAKNDKKASL